MAKNKSMSKIMTIATGLLGVVLADSTAAQVAPMLIHATPGPGINARMDNADYETTVYGDKSF